jgi:diadenosine tetraphosphate (Ap4A) HIT family hydrolase
MPATPQVSWTIHFQLASDTIPLGDLGLSHVALMKDANYPWLLLLPRRPNVIEIIDLTEAEQAELMREIARVARALKSVTHCDKLNIAALGNVVPQLHVHIIARFRNDASWPQPVWARGPAEPYTGDALRRFTAVLQQAIQFG